ncbi:DnaJ domain-containing protein [bacterium]|nr:DnaJ domain-containing protein [bacterium]
MVENKQKKIPDGIIQRIEEYDKNLSRWSHYDLLYIPKNAEKSHIKKGYYRIVQLMHPDRYGIDLAQEYKEQLERIFNEINIAYNVLMDEAQKSKYDQALYRAEDHNEPLKPTNDVIVAKAQYSRGIKALKENQVTSAIEFFRSAVDLDSEKIDYSAKLALAIAKHKNPRTRREAVKHCQKAISSQNENPNYHALMGYIYQQLGNNKEAKIHYKRALSWDPHHHRSRQEIQKINQLAAEEKKKKSLGYKILSIFKPPKKTPKQSHRTSRRKK